MLLVGFKRILPAPEISMYYEYFRWLIYMYVCVKVTDKESELWAIGLNTLDVGKCFAYCECYILIATKPNVFARRQQSFITQYA